MSSSPIFLLKLGPDNKSSFDIPLGINERERLF
jgi:hypothetical protein